MISVLKKEGGKTTAWGV